MTAQPLPNSPDAEKGVLSSCLQDQSVIAEVARTITAAHMFNRIHADMYNAILEMDRAGQRIDLITFTQYLTDHGQLKDVGGAGYVAHVQDFAPTSAYVAAYVEILQDKFVLRGLIAACAESVRRAYDEQAEVSETLAFARESLEALPESQHGNLPPIMDMSDVLSKPIALPDDVIEGVLHRGAKMVLGGGSKSFKTWSLIDLVASVTTGSLWLCKFPTKRGRVLYINLELQEGWFSKRVRDVCDAQQTTLERGMFTVWNLRGYAADLSKLLPRLLRAIRRDQYVLIVLDPIYKLLGGRDENKAGDIASLLNEIELLAVKTGAAVAFGAHFSKGNQSQKDSMDRIGGSGVFARDPDTILTFTRHDETDCFTVDATLRNHPPIEAFVVRWEFPLMCADLTLDPANIRGAGAKAKATADQTLSLLTTAMEESQWRDLATKGFKISRRTFERKRDELAGSGLTVFDAGKWSKK
jgi:AAA domain/DnaB-like helicase N terminal domain